MDIVDRLLESKRNLKRVRDSRDKTCLICGKDLSKESVILVKGINISCREHFQLGEDGWKLDIII